MCWMYYSEGGVEDVWDAECIYWFRGVLLIVAESTSCLQFARLIIKLMTLRNLSLRCKLDGLGFGDGGTIGNVHRSQSTMLDVMVVKRRKVRDGRFGFVR